MKKIIVGDTVPNFYYKTPWSEEDYFHNSLREKRTILLFHRHFGCRLCQLDITRLIEKYDLIQSKNAQLFMVLQSAPEVITAHEKKENIPFTFICDPHHRLYRLFGVEPAETLELAVNESVKAKVEEAIIEGMVNYENNGDEIVTQLPACFIIEPNKVVSYVHYGQDAGDLPSVDELSTLLEQTSESIG